MPRSLATAELLAPLVGLVPFNASKGHGSFVTCSLTRTPDDPAEEFYFWIYLCNWWIYAAEETLAHCESSDDIITSAVSALNGKKLESIVLQQVVTSERVFHDATLWFEQRLRMKLCQYEEGHPTDPIFSTRNAEGMWVSYLANGSIEVDKPGEAS